MDSTTPKRPRVSRFRPPPTLRASLIFLVVATIAPLLAFITVVLVINTRLQEQAVEAHFVGLARTLAVAVERDLRAIEAALQVLARSPALDAEDWDEFHRLAAEVGAMHGGWIAVIDRDNRQVVNTAVAPGATPPGVPAMTAMDVARRAGKPMVTDLLIGAAHQRPMIAVIVPGIRGGGVPFLLVMGLVPERIATLLTSQRFDPAEIALVFDRSGRVVARVPAGGRPGEVTTPELPAAIRANGEGWVRGGPLDQASHYFAFARVPHADWTVGLATPGRSAYARATRALYTILAGALAALVLAPWLALRLGRRIADPLAALAAAARDGDDRATMPKIDSTVAEIWDLRRALADAAETRRREWAERQGLAMERDRRHIAEQALAAVAASEERWHVLFEEAADAILVGDLGGVCRNANAAACDLLNCAREELVGASLARLLPGEELARILSALTSLAPGERLVEEWTLTRPGPATLVVEVRGRMASDGRWQALLRDITERRRAEDERVRLFKVTEAARAQAETASRIKDQFLATLSHELRTPLSSILGWLKLLRSGALDSGRTARALDVIKRNVDAQSILVRDLLDLTRLVRGNLRLDLQEHALSPIVIDACEAFAPDAEAKGITLDSTVEPDITGIVDANRIQQVIWNLVSNALKFTPRGGRVDVRLTGAPAGHATLTVSDTGRGIPQDFLPHVFEQFRQLEEDALGHAAGLGLGLTIVKHLVERHAGTVTAESPGPGAGATFIVILPLPADPTVDR
jgi:PAS domain S-box-containing protein